MLSGVERRTQIKEQLLAANKALSANYFAGQFKVSRQTIVGDIALLRASGEGITAAFNGYLYRDDRTIFTGKIACKHSPAQTETELRLIVANGGQVLDVTVAHELYGELTGQLNLTNNQEVTRFMHNYRTKQAHLLSELTAGVHLHTLACADATQFNLIKEKLQAAGILFTAN
ncbi:transcription repressor NadR [Loigolactobacillus zhaoyuanensis]|uniref:3H domain-containing protein n=1 Tax=Loigolactobacillus zhaoyuanensis TaxID=2486017 RepID=A0ABW8UB55_9LACO|nr:transcription repressor NadR [Loigolactobacillus zhaoyuanensis]